MRSKSVQLFIGILLATILTGCGASEANDSGLEQLENISIEAIEEKPSKKIEEEPEIIDEDAIIEEARGYIFVGYNEKNIDKAIELLEPLADSENAEAQYLMGWISDFETIENDDTEMEALEWYKKAMQQNHIKSYLAGCTNKFATYDDVIEWQGKWNNSEILESDNVDVLWLLALNYRTGIDFIPDENKAKECYEKAAELGDVHSMDNLGNMIEDETIAFKWFEKAAETGYPNGLSNLGYCYSAGYGVEQDVDKGIQLFEKAGDMGYTSALTNLGYMYRYGDEFDIDIDIPKAIEKYEQAAELGDVQAYGYIAQLYENGEGVELDEDKAFEYYKKAGELGSDWCADTTAWYLLKKYEKPDEAELWFEKAARLGYEEDILYVASEYLAEQTDESFKKAIELYKIGMRNGSAECFCNLGAMYNMGHGVEKDNAMAAKLLLTAEKLGSENATQLMQADEIKEEIEKLNLND